MQVVSRRLQNKLTLNIKYNLLPNSDHKYWKKQNPIINLHLESNKKGPLGQLRIEVFCVSDEAVR